MKSVFTMAWRALKATSLAAGCCFAIRAAGGQEAEAAARPITTVIVTDSSGIAIQGALVTVDHTTRKTDAKGIARLDIPGSGQIEGMVRAIGAREALFKGAAGTTFRVTLGRIQLMRDVLVRGAPPMSRAKRSRMDGFFRRRAQGGGGSFIDRKAIEARDPSRVIDLLRTVSGIRISYRGTTPHVRFLRCEQVEVYINGFRATQGFSDLFALHPQEIEALEVYYGMATVPPEFSPRPNDCAAVVAWTR